MAELHSRILSKSALARELAVDAGVSPINHSSPVAASFSRHSALILRGGVIKSSAKLPLAMEILAQRILTEMADRLLVLLSTSGNKKITLQTLDKAGYKIFGVSKAPLPKHWAAPGKSRPAQQSKARPTPAAGAAAGGAATAAAEGTSPSEADEFL